MASALVAVPACQVCGSEARELMFREGLFEVVRCSACTLVWVTPRMSGEELLREVYGEHYWRSESPKTRGYYDYAKDEHLYLKTFRRRLRLLRPLLTRVPSKVLDVGCAAGYFLRAVAEAGHDPYGVEVSAPIARRAADTLPTGRVHVGTLASAIDRTPEWARGSFDLVTMWDVIEHVPDPQQLLREAHSMLKPDGLLVLETQNVDSHFARLLGRKWQHFKHEEHLYHFNPSTVRSLLQQAGFTPVRITPRYGGKYVSFGFISERAARLSAVLSFVLKPLALFSSANLYVNLRDEMVVVARPNASAAH